MLKDLFQLTRLYLRIYWLPSVLWIAVQFLVIAKFRSLTIVESLAEPIPAEPSTTLLFVLAGVLSLSFMILLIFLGNLFSSGQRTSWLRSLPFRASSLNLFPLLVTLSYGLCLLIFIPWGAFTSGVSVFTLGIPVAIFLLLKNSRNYLFGLFSSAALGVGLIAMWIYLFYDWSHLQSQYKVELLALILFAVIWSVLARKERVYPTSISLGLLVAWIGLGLFHQFRTPQNFVEATLDHHYLPTLETAARLKAMALDKSHWESVEQFKLPIFVQQRAQDFANGFSDDEKIQFIENIEANYRKWKDVKLPEYRPLRVAIFPQPEIRFRNYSAFPIGKFNVTDKVEAHLYSHWRDSRLFCQLLPVRKTPEYLEKMFANGECSSDLFTQGIWSHYSLFEDGEFERQFDHYLLEIFEKAPAKTRSRMMMFLSGGWDLPREKYEKERQVLFSQKPLSKELLEQMKGDRFRKALGQFKKLPRERESFFKELDKFSVSEEEPTFPLIFITKYLLGDPDMFLNRKKSETLSLLQSWGRRSHDLRLRDWGVWVSLWREEMEKPNYWPELEKLFKYVDQRDDL